MTLQALNPYFSPPHTSTRGDHHYYFINKMTFSGAFSIIMYYCSQYIMKVMKTLLSWGGKRAQGVLLHSNTQTERAGLGWKPRA